MKTRLLLVALLTLGIVSFPSLSSAQQALTIGPAASEYKMKPGETITNNIMVKSNTSQSNVSAYFYDFKSNDVDGNPVLLKSDETSPYSLKSWLKPIPSFNLSAGETKRIPLTITVPSTAKNQTYFGTVVFGTDSDALTASTGSLVFVTVGEPKYDGIIEETTSKEQLGKTIFEQKITNKGSYRFTPMLSLEVKDASGTVLATLQPDISGSVLPASSRVYTYTYNGVFAPTVEYSVKPSAMLPDGAALSGSDEIAFNEPTPPPTENSKTADTTKSEDPATSYLPYLAVGIVALLVLALTTFLIIKKKRSKPAGTSQFITPSTTATPSATTPQKPQPPEENNPKL